MIRSLLFLLALTLAAPYAVADWQLRSWSRWEITGDGAEAVLGIERVELQRLAVPDDVAWFSAEAARSVGFSSAGTPCALSASGPQASLPGLLVLRMHFRCPAAVASPLIRVRLLGDIATQPLHYASVLYRGRVSDALLTPSADALAPREITEAPGRLGVLRSYTALGFLHILEGLDHVVFLLCLLLAAPGFARRAWMVTGFTLGHSVTLSLSALGLLRVQTAGVEALIGFTVALLAAETWRRAYRRPTAMWLLCTVCAVLLAAALAGHSLLPLSAALALLVLVPAYLHLSERAASLHLLHLGMMAVFGLVHGLGFASALRSIGLPEGQRGWALAGFNAGVEIGQLVLLGVFGAVLALLFRLAGDRRAGEGAGMLSALLCATGVYWLVQRAL